jgi:prolyl 4-hydroxylase
LKPAAPVATQPTKNSPPISETVLTFTGFAAKFVNMGPNPILLYWDGRGGDDRNRRLVGEIAPFEALTTATRPGESFSVSPVYDHSLALDRWTLTADDAVQYFEPSRKAALSGQEQILYNFQKLNQEFAKHYLIHSGRTWLSNFPRAFPMHFMWRAEYFGHRHEVEATSINEGISIDHIQQRYTLEVQSVTPRVFKIENFLSKLECDSLIRIAIQNGLKASTVYAGGEGYNPRHHRDVTTRSSTNTWLTRDHHINLTDTIYRRAAQVMRIDEASFGHKAPIDDSVDDAKYHSIAESLQVVRYKVDEEYSPHHDWVLPSQLNRYQPTRFATLLIYLNDDFEGGHTVFPRAVNKQYHNGVQIKPQKGTAVLFYNLLPDGNVDDLSQHGSEKVTKGEKVRVLDSVMLLHNAQPYIFFIH